MRRSSGTVIVNFYSSIKLILNMNLDLLEINVDCLRENDVYILFETFIKFDIFSFLKLMLICYRRSVSDNKKYVCKRSQRCTLKVNDSTGYRKICRECRFKRCLDIGMLPESKLFWILYCHYLLSTQGFGFRLEVYWVNSINLRIKTFSVCYFKQMYSYFILYCF